MHSVEQGARGAAASPFVSSMARRLATSKSTSRQFASPKFDWRQMQRWGISESSLPPGSKIYFRSRRYGSGIRGRLRSSPRLFSYRPGLSRSCYVSIVGVN